MFYLRTDQYTHMNINCPLRVDLHPADDVVEISLGEYRVGEATLRLVVDHPDTCLRLVEAVEDARNRLIEHLRVRTDSAMSRY
jgi:hypothetical protein